MKDFLEAREDEEADISQSVEDAVITTRRPAFFESSSLWPQLEEHGCSFNAGQDTAGLSIGCVDLAEVQHVSDVHSLAAPAPRIESKVITISLPPILQDTPRRSDFSIAF